MQLALRALLLLAVAQHAHAGCTAGYLALDLLNANSTDCRSSLLARCLSTFRVAVDAACAIQLTPLAGGGAYVPAIWSTHAAATYARLQECPTSASAAVPTSSDPTEAEVKAAIQTALERHIYGDAYALAVSGVAWDTGTVLVTTAADTCQLKFGITSIDNASNSLVTKLAPHAVKVQCLVAGLLSVGEECELDPLLAPPDCSPGRRPVALTALTQACALCTPAHPTSTLEYLGPRSTYQPYLGQAAGSACLACPDPEFTSYTGADDCTVPVVTVCPDGHELNSLTDECDGCPAGTKRDSATEEFCIPCPPGHYSPVNASSCTPCPLDQFSPIYGLAEQDAVGVKKCWYCPNGTLAITEDSQSGQTGSTACDPCPPGTFSKVVGGATHRTCAACEDGYYRAGWGSAINNECKQIPAGWKESNRTVAAYDRAKIELCNKGEVSSWSGATRTPPNPEACSPCVANTYAPRRGMAACQQCVGGTAPTSSVGSPGFDKCTACEGNTYRPVSSTSSTCLVCTAGKEVHGTSHRGCSPCSAGWFMPDEANGTNLALPALSGSCSRCPTFLFYFFVFFFARPGVVQQRGGARAFVLQAEFATRPANQYQNRTGQAACVLCPAGSSTSDTGNTQCYPCPLGTYSTSPEMNCVPAPEGSYVGTTGATAYTACPTGTFSNSAGAEACDICVAGQYANVKGSKACKTCGAGSWSSGAAASCTKCLPGYYASPGSGMCSPCKPGSFSNVSGMGVCLGCPLGRQCPSIATKEPQPCPKGSYSNKEGARLCTLCAANTYQDVRGQRGCKVCASGYTTRGLQGQSACQPMRTQTRRMLRSHFSS
ncbi:hypothetical protein CHLNCDRAFT_58424 [Chlorella variabilis]|uniref:Tyrosine-protein kinase ephrin type A/B receptor-like domain-containing protein n=1 Tax=Chlorella variabilis TaxID=554065 RepID=E1ZK32_CHLVA|nr:hypothetical protein CHLNCDRAFT_58424 [Chlorella variabilis]EFN53625.1 hypothetical protein CHLNCDRAFT_58424 [Chlorella variabilis]|eukprot:XP_005845727.1 hypothetical protein CHLNCDRAFT_58424 [Chlorella variabilis]